MVFETVSTAKASLQSAQYKYLPLKLVSLNTGYKNQCQATINMESYITKPNRTCSAAPEKSGISYEERQSYETKSAWSWVILTFSSIR